MAKKQSLKIENRPLYDLAVEALQEFLKQGQYKPGDKLPSEKELAKLLGISRSTLREAVGSLETQGIVVRRHGVGTFVTVRIRGHLRRGLEHLERLQHLTTGTGISERSTWIVQTATATDELAEILNLASEDKLLRVQITVTIDNNPFTYMNSYIAEELVDAQALRTSKEDTLLDYLLDKTDIDLAYTYTNIYTVIADHQLAARLNIAEGNSLLHLVETFYTASGQPILHSYNYFMTDVINFHIIRRVIKR